MPTATLAPAGARDPGAFTFAVVSARRGRGPATGRHWVSPWLVLVLLATVAAFCPGCATGRLGPRPMESAPGPAPPPPAVATTTTPAPSPGPVSTRATAGPAPEATPAVPADPFPPPARGHPGFFARLGQAAREALTDPGTWAPAAGAVVVGAAGLDRPISDWATRTTPIFGSQQKARHASDAMEMASTYLVLGTTLARTYDPNPYLWMDEALEREAIASTVGGLSAGVTAGLKSAADRRRPDGTDDRSLPSGHTSMAVTEVTLARRDIARLGLPPAPTWILQAGATTLAAGVAWGRIEGHKHYASDVLAGWALGHFLGAMLSDAWLGPAGHGIDLEVGPGAGGGLGVQVGAHF